MKSWRNSSGLAFSVLVDPNCYMKRRRADYCGSSFPTSSLSRSGRTAFVEVDLGAPDGSCRSKLHDGDHR